MLRTVAARSDAQRVTAVRFPQRRRRRGGLSRFLAIGLMLAPCCEIGAVGQTKPSGEKGPRQKGFDLMDGDGDERLNPEEFVAGSLGKSADNKRAEFKERDADGDGRLTFKEYNKRLGPPPAPDEKFAKRDRDEDGALSEREFVGARTGGDRTWALRYFYKRDRDDDEFLTPEEFAGKPGPVSPGGQFRLMDADSDGELSEAEFVGPKEGGKWHDAARRNFGRFDVDDSGSLSPDEFRLLPKYDPDAGTLFEARDQNGDGDGQLTPEELTQWMKGGEARQALATFERHDGNGDGRLSRSEYMEREDTLAWESRVGYWKGLLATWGTWALVALDAALVVWLVRAFLRWRRSSESSNESTDPKPERDEDRLSESPATDRRSELRSPASIDDFEVL